MERLLNDIIKFKVHIQKNLGDYESFVADELQKEMGEFGDEGLDPSDEEQGGFHTGDEGLEDGQ